MKLVQACWLALLCVFISAGGQSQANQDDQPTVSNADDDGLAGADDAVDKEAPLLNLSEVGGDENELPTGNSERQFAIADHPEDHSVYSGRSLMSTTNIKRLTSDEQSALEEDLSAKKKASRVHDIDDEERLLKTVDYAEKEWQLMFRSLDMAYDGTFLSILQELDKRTNLLDEIVARLPPVCRRDIYHVRDSVRKHRLWALRMVDSNGKIPSGITYGRFASPGDYEECLRVQVNERVYRGQTKNNRSEQQAIISEHKFHGKYCLIDFRLPLPEKPADKMLSIHESVLNFTGTELQRQYPDFVSNYSAYAAAFYEIGYMHAFCLPSTCQVEDFTKSVGKSLEGMYIIVNSTVDCEDRPASGEPLRRSQIVALLIMGFVFCNAALASFAYYLQASGAKLLDEKRTTDSRPTIGRTSALGRLWRKLVDTSQKNKFYSDCFSIQRNFERLSKSDPRGLTFVHYTRIVAMALTVITHTGALGTLQAITKPADASNSEQIFRDFLPQMLANAFTSIQIFFFMAGFMLVISTYPAIRRDKGQMSFLEYAIKRAIRLMPGLGATVCLNFLWPLVVDGPMLKYFVRMIVVPCENNWWHTLGFMSNFDHVEKMCLRHSYFSASDYQLHIIAFPLLLLLYKQPVLSLFLAGLLTASGFVAQVIMVLTKNVLPFMMVDYLDKEAFLNVIHYIHHPVWNHMSAFFYGFIIGYFVVRQVRLNMSARAIKIVWYTLIPMGLLSIYAPYYWNHYKRPIHRWQMILYVIFDRFVLLTTCAWLSYASMVLSRPVRRDRPAPDKPTSADNSAEQAQAPATQISLPVIIQAPPSPDDKQLRRKMCLFETTSKNKPDSPVNGDSQTPDSSNQSPMHLRPGLPGSALPRQRSSPNLAQEQQAQPASVKLTDLSSSSLNLRKMIRTASSSNLATIAELASSAQKPDDKGAKSGRALAEIELTAPKIGPSKEVAAESGNQQSRAKKNSAPPISNLNTLCLILSRLTFQLYLFNMVVLWVDVNNSKYYWFFSYYFIIIKAAAVYIASAVMAMIFFVVLESPCLTLYIAWVRGRAASHARTSITVKPTALVESNSGNSANHDAKGLAIH